MNNFEEIDYLEMQNINGGVGATTVIKFVLKGGIKVAVASFVIGAVYELILGE